MNFLRLGMKIEKIIQKKFAFCKTLSNMSIKINSTFMIDKMIGKIKKFFITYLFSV